ncbi:MAG: NYN domain-containing protein [Allosphingosinicella sp.]|uniref:NYN domain-containing protein n=1 Tax=Allosphingosinicella sp. TaxID=2823234 RepID=UPI003940A930
MPDTNNPAREPNVALLIDADNASPAALDAVLSVLAELGTVNIRRAYGNWVKPELKGWTERALRYALEPQQQFDLTKGKNATDMKMTIDAMDLLYGGRVQGFGIMSSDCDFMPLVLRIRHEGIKVYGFGTSRAAEGFRPACTRFFDVDALMGTAGGRGGEGNGKSAPDLDEEALTILIDAYNAAQRDENGFANLSALGQLVSNRSSFDVRNYGFSRLSELFEALPNFSVEKRNDSLWVKRMR